MDPAAGHPRPSEARPEVSEEMLTGLCAKAEAENILLQLRESAVPRRLGKQRRRRKGPPWDTQFFGDFHGLFKGITCIFSTPCFLLGTLQFLEDMWIIVSKKKLRCAFGLPLANLQQRRKGCEHF